VKNLLILSLAALAFFAFQASVWAQELQMAPVNPDFIKFVANKGAVAEDSGEYSFGEVPSPLNFPDIPAQPPESEYPIEGYSPSYDLRDLGKVTGVRDQNPCGVCWTFAAFASMESYLLTGETTDFSEENMRTCHGFDWSKPVEKSCNAGNREMASAYLLRWDGPIAEADDLYTADLEETCQAGLTIQKKIDEVIFLPNRASSTDNDTLKWAITNYGVIRTSMYWDDPSWNSSTNAYYYSTAGTSTNHAVAIVGWDDNFAAANFNSAPAGNGAFLIKNSWGDTWFGDSGYFWISYYDTRAMRNNAIFTASTDADNLYQHDPFWVVGAVGYGSTMAWGGNVFTATGDEEVQAVGFYAATPATSYVVRVYTGVVDTPSSGTLAGTKSGTLTYAGQYSIDVSDLDIVVSSGSKFSAVVQFTTPGDNNPIPLEWPVAGNSSNAEASAGESYISSNGAAWTDSAIWLADCNVCIKAYTDDLFTFTVTGDSCEPGCPVNDACETDVSPNYLCDLSSAPCVDSGSDAICTGALGDSVQCGAGEPYCYNGVSGVICYAAAKVDLLDFAAERVDAGVKLSWKTAQEIECGAFKILRCETATPGACELWSHTELGITIPCEDNPMGADYTTVDTTAKKDQAYSYYLREYDTTDRVFEYGPLFMSIDDSIMNTGHVEPYESTFDILAVPPSDDGDDDADDDDDDAPVSGADDAGDSKGGCGM
jgi:C1A family cysteine protease